MDKEYGLGYPLSVAGQMEEVVQQRDQWLSEAHRRETELRASVSRLETLLAEAMNLAMNGPGTPSRELWTWWRIYEMTATQPTAVALAARMSALDKVPH